MISAISRAIFAVINIAKKVRNVIRNLFYSAMWILFCLVEDDPIAVNRQMLLASEFNDEQLNDDNPPIFVFVKPKKEEHDGAPGAFTLCETCRKASSTELRYVLWIRENFNEALSRLVLDSNHEPNHFKTFLNIMKTLPVFTWTVFEADRADQRLTVLKLFFERREVFTAVSTCKDSEKAKSQCGFQVIMHWLCYLTEKSYSTLIANCLIAMNDRLFGDFEAYKP